MVRATLIVVAVCALSSAIPTDAAGAPSYEPGEVLVRFRQAASSPGRKRAHDRTGARVVRRMPSVSGLELVAIPSGTTVDDAVAAYRNDPDVLYAEPNYIVQALDVPNDARFGELWGLHNVGQSGGVVDADIDAVEAWDVTTGSADVVVAVIDTGIAYTHPDLAANVFRNEADCDDDGVDDDANGWTDDCHGIDTVNDDGDPMDDEAHGTHVAGTIGAVGGNGVGVVGVSRQVRLMACKFLNAGGRGTTADAVRCLEYVAGMRARGVNVVATNNSWGGGGYSVALEDAIRQQLANDILFVAAAGNDAFDNDLEPHLPSSYDVPNVVSVAASTPRDDLATFSNFGRHTVHLSAPGDAIVSTVLGGAYDSYRGTSMAAPHVSGVAALLAAQDPGRTWVELRNLILAGAESRPALARSVTGGRLNAHAALTCSGRELRARLRPAGTVVAAAVGAPLTLAALHVDCAAPAGETTVTASGGVAVTTLRDDGNGVDQVAGDGVYAAQWVPPGAGTFTLTFPGGDVVTVEVTTDLILGPAPSAGARFGSSFANVPGGLAIGAPGTSGGGVVYVVDPVTGVTVSQIDNPTPSAGDDFGWSMATAGDLLVVGAPTDDAGATNAGAVHLFDAATGAHRLTIPHPNPRAHEQFGYAVGIVGGNVLVGAPYFVNGSFYDGVAYLFDGTDGTLLHTFVKPLGENALFGWAFATDGTRAIVGTPGVLGAVFMFDAGASSPSLGQLLRTITYRGPAIGLQFGYSVAVAGDALVIGDRLGIHDPAVVITGEVHVVGLNDGVLRRRIGVPRVRPGHITFFGEALAVDGDDVLVGASEVNYSDEREGVVFRIDVPTGALVEGYVRGPRGYESGFGMAVAVTPAGVRIGAPFDNLAGAFAGAVYTAVPADMSDPRFDRDRLCYKATSWPGFARPASQVLGLLVDAFETRSFVAGNIDQACNAAVFGTGTPEGGYAQLACRKIAAPGRFVPTTVEVTTALGTHGVKLRKPRNVCMPAGFESGPLPTPNPAYKCYTATVDGPAPDPIQTTITDAFGTIGMSVRATVRSYCTKVTINGVRTDDGDDLVCYALKPLPGTPPFSPTMAFLNIPQLENPHRLRVSKRDTLCLTADRSPP